MKSAPIRLVQGARWLPFAALVVATTVTYAATLLPGLHHFGDVTKAQFLGRLLGTTHPTGYPLYILLTAPFSWLPLGSLAQRINAFSALAGVVTVVGLYGIQRLLEVRRPFAALAAFAFGVSRVFWDQTVIAEVYSLNTALMTGTFYCLLRWREGQHEVRWFVSACAVYSLSFGNHPTVVMFLPAFALATFTGDVRSLLRVKWVLAVLGCIAAGMALYAYLFTRTPTNTLYLEYRVRNFDEFVAYVSGEDYRPSMLAFSKKRMLFERLPRFVRQAYRDLGPFVLLAPLGLIANRDRRATAILGLAALVSLAWVCSYDIPDIEIYLIPVELILAIFVGVALDRVAGRFEEVASVRAVRPISVASIAMAGAFLLVRHNAPDHEKSEAFQRELDERIAQLGSDAILLGPIDYDERMGFVHRLYAEGLYAERNLHLADRASLDDVARYLRGQGNLRDKHSRRPLRPGMHVYVESRSFDKPWRRKGLVMVRRGPGLRELTLARVPEPSTP